EMLGRLDRSFDAQRRFTADASHELRSPLSRLRAELEVTLRRPRTAEEYGETLRSSLDEVERLQRLTDELLRLARIDAREEPELPEAIPVREIIQAALDVVGPEAESRGIALEVSGPGDVLVSAAPGAARLALAKSLRRAGQTP